MNFNPKPVKNMRLGCMLCGWSYPLLESDKLRDLPKVFMSHKCTGEGAPLPEIEIPEPPKKNTPKTSFREEEINYLQEDKKMKFSTEELLELLLYEKLKNKRL